MVTVVPADEGWGEAFSKFGQGFSQGAMNRSDQKALQKAIDDLPPNADPRDVLKAVTNVRTYDNKAKQDFLKSSLEVDKYRQHFEETQKKHQLQEVKAKEKESKRMAEEKKAQNEREVADSLIDNANIPDEQKQALRGKIGTNTAAALATKNADASEYEIAKNQSKRFEPEVDYYHKKALEAKQLMPITEATILNNEKYGGLEKTWDTALDAINSSFLNQFKSKTGQELEAYTPVSVAGFGTKMGGQMTDKRMQLISKKAVGLGRDQNANRLFLYLDYYDRKLDMLRNDFANEIISENKYGLPPKDLDKQLDKKMAPYQKMIGKDIDNLLNDKRPTSEMSQMSVVQQYKQELQPGEVLVVSPDGATWALTEEELKMPEYKKYKRL